MAGPLHFAPIFKERVWGGDKLKSYIRETAPGEGVVGEAWLISDHPSAESVVADGPHRGRTLHELLAQDATAILGRLAKLTPHGRFPLLLKLLDAGLPLSVQVHPDDACAERLSEPDVGKTEMWHVIQADAGSELVCGLDTSLNAAGFREAVEHGGIEDSMTRFEAAPGDSVFVPAGTVHAIGGGILLAEIQQNSDLTYRIYDYNRRGPDGSLRELHVEKAAEAIHFGSSHTGKNEALALPTVDGLERRVLAASQYFAAERLDLFDPKVEGRFSGDTKGASFHIALCLGPKAVVTSEIGEHVLLGGEAALIPASVGRYEIAATAPILLYYVPDLASDIVEPLRAAGHSDGAIVRLGGDPAYSDLTTFLS